MERVQEIISSNAVVMFSKKSFKNCASVEKLLSQLRASYKDIQLDTESDGIQIEQALAVAGPKWTGQKTFPNVFIGGNHIGTWDCTKDLYHRKRLIPLLESAGALDGGPGEVREEPEIITTN